MRWSGRLAVLIAAGLATACSGGSKGLSVRAQASGSDTTTATKLELNGGTIVVDRVRMAVREVEVEGTPSGGACPSLTSPTPTPTPTPTPAAGTTTAASTGADDHGDTDDDHDGECELEFGPFAVDLSGAALVNGIHQQFEIPVPAGTYREVSFDINTVNAQKAGSDAVLKDLAALHASIVVDGTIDGKPFQLTTPMAVESSHEGAITVDPANGAGLTLDIDPTKWFTAADGQTRLDPNATTDQGAILANLRASLRLEHDDDANGCDDEDRTCGKAGGTSSGH